ncbi:hypothetical protein QYM36_017675 [Artemia franciscana]|uniref:Dehydrogenase/reductase SDR family member 7 n=1 Tax=Artemia franciscana TaxID=6661 RepID=A0AA88H866_ARTSF|nr:hypothetical protein QYM36_017675 [Artemia franciscana]
MLYLILETLEGKVVWITGASSGIGEFLAYELAKCGVKLALSARRESELLRVKSHCEEIGAKPSDVLVVPLDITAYDKHEEAFKKILSHFGDLDILVNNAGRSQRANWEKIELQVDRDLFEVNVFGLIGLTRTVLPHFLKKQSGHLVVTSSTAGKLGVPFSGSYTATKHALHGYFESLRTEKAAFGIKITIVCPGPVFSNILRQAATEKAGSIFGEDMKSSDNRVSTQRCAQLMAIAIANEVTECWIAFNPVMFFMYYACYLPDTFRRFTAVVNSKRFMKLRDSRDTMESLDKKDT